MPLFKRALLLALAFLPLTTSTSNGQLVQDTLFTWKGYTSPGISRVQIYINPLDTLRGYTFVLKELSENSGRSTVDDIGYLAELIGRSFNIDPTKAYWIIHWGSFSYRNADRSRKELFLRATFRRTSTQRLGTAQWRIIHREDIERYTDRHFR